MKKTGELLKAKRESANLSLSEVALATKINPKVLQAIENGESDKLPAKTFLKGFVRSYALYLKADLDEVLRVFTEETGGSTPPTVHEAYQKTEGAPAPRSRPPDEESSSGLRTALVLVIALLIGAIIGVRELIEKYQKEKMVTAGEVKVSPLPEGTPAAEAAKVADAVSAAVTPKPVDTPLALVKASEAEVSRVTKAPASTEPPRPVKIEEIAPVELPTAVAALPTSAAPVPAAVPTPARSAPTPSPAPASVTSADSSATEPAEEPKPAPPKKARNEIILEAKDKVDVSFKLHGESKHLSMGPDDVHTIRAQGPLALEVSDGGALTIIFNGTERGAAGSAGQPAQVQLP